MQEVFEKIKEKIRKEIEDVIVKDTYTKGKNAGLRKAEIFIDEVAAEYNSGWIPCSERMPDEYGDYLVAWKPLHMSAEDIIRKVGRAIPHYYEIVEYDPDDEELWIGSIEQAQGEYEIIAWQPLPSPYQPKGEQHAKL